MINHEKVFKAAKRDDQFRADLDQTHQKFPSMFADTLVKGIWASAYSGWIMGRYGPAEYERRVEQWREM